MLHRCAVDLLLGLFDHEFVGRSVDPSAVDILVGRSVGSLVHGLLDVIADLCAELTADLFLHLSCFRGLLRSAADLELAGSILILHACSILLRGVRGLDRVSD